MTTATLPSALERSIEQRMAALERANEIRSSRAQLKRDLKAGRADTVATLLEPDDEVQTMKVWDLLLALPKVGRVKANRTLLRNQISPSKTIGGLSDRQRRVLVADLRGHGA